MTADDVYVLMMYILNKNQQGYFGPADFFTAINQGQRSYQSWLLGSFQTYTPGRPISKVELGQNSVVRQRLTPTIYKVPLAVDSNGNCPYPADYIQSDSMYTTTGNKRIRNVQQNSLDENINSTIDPVATNPIYLIEDTGFQFYPVSIATAKLSYIGNAPDIIWGYTEDEDGIPVYNPATSQHPVWSNAAMMDIIERALKIAGVNLQNGAVLQYANDLKLNGQ